MISLDAATVLLQWAVGGLFWLWVTTRRREVGLGYGWLLRSVFLVLAIGSFAVGVAFDTVPVREVSTAGVVIATAYALAVSIVRKRAGVSGHRAEHDRRSARVAAMTGIDRAHAAEEDAPSGGREFPPGLDLVAPIIGVVGLVAAGARRRRAGSPRDRRTLVGAAFLGVVTDAMLLGHWYLVQPGLPRGRSTSSCGGWSGSGRSRSSCSLARRDVVGADRARSTTVGTARSAGSGSPARVTTIGARRSRREPRCKERQYSAVMAATGLLYLAILTAFGMDLVARAVLAG